MSRKAELTLLYRIARMYYIEKMPQSKIAEIENISRSQISRLLDRAEKDGIVTISVQYPDRPDAYALADAVKQILGIERIYAAAIDGDSASDEERRSAIVQTAVPILSKAFRSAKTVGIGWGRTMYETSLKLPYRRSDDDTCFIPLIGVSGTNNPALQINTIVDRMAEKHHAKSFFVSQPTYRSKESSLSGIDKKRIEELRSLWYTVDLAVFGLGTPPQEGNFFITELDPVHAEGIRKANVTGEILSQFYREDGSVVSLKDAYDMTAFDITRLKEIRRRYCLAGGADKARAIIVGARMGCFDTLITDTVTLREIYDLLRQKGEIK